MEHLALLFILALALGVLIFSRIPSDAVGVGVIVLLILTGTSTPSQALVGFAHPATLIVAGILLMSAGIQRTGVVDGLAFRMRRLGAHSESRFLHLQTSVVAPMSAFLSNTGVVAVFLPVVLQVVRERSYSVSRLLLPLTYASLLGGMCTLIGTSTNIVVANLAVDHGLPALHMFDFLPVGICIAVPGMLYLMFVSGRLVPDRRHGGELAADYHLRRYLTEVEILAGSPLAGRTIEQAGLSRFHDMEVLEIHRGDDRIDPTGSTELKERDALLVLLPLGTIQRIQGDEGLRIRSEGKVDLPDLIGSGMLLAEAVVPPGSPLAGRTLQSSSFRNRYGVTALALYHRREYVREKVGKVPLRVGDGLLLYGSRTRLKQLASYPEVLSVIQIHPSRPRRRLAKIAVGILVATVSLAASGLVSLVTAVVAGASLMVLSGCLTAREAIRGVDRGTIFLLAGMISLGMAMDRTGAAQDFASNVIEGAGVLGPTALLAATYVVTALLTEVLTNNACAVIMTPIAVAVARDTGYDPTPFVLAVAYGSSASFLSPLGYQTNMFVYGAGGFRYGDFARAGWPLSLIALLAVTFVLPHFWPLVPR